MQIPQDIAETIISPKAYADEDAVQEDDGAVIADVGRHGGTLQIVADVADDAVDAAPVADDGGHARQEQEVCADARAEGGDVVGHRHRSSVGSGSCLCGGVRGGDALVRAAGVRRVRVPLVRSAVVVRQA